MSQLSPTACAVGCILSPLRGWAGALLHHSMLRELVAVDDKFRVGTGTKFVEIHSLPLTFGVYAMGVDVTDQPVQAVGERKN